jgi:hypothetical protein
VTGKFAGRHRGNGIATKVAAGWEVPAFPAADLKAFSKDFDASVYLRLSSDIGAFLLFEQQITLHNLLIRAALQTRCLLESDREINELLGQTGPREQSSRIIEHLAAEICAALLLKGEPDLAPAKITAEPAFAAEFAAQWPAGASGHRLGTIEMKTRLFELPLSPMIHAPAFQVLPDALRLSVLKHLRAALSGTEWPEGVAPLSAETKAKLHQHLQETVKGY